MPLKTVYKGKRILVTGHTGFKGSWLCLWLRELGAEVYGMALEPATDQDNFVITGLKNLLHHHICNINEQEQVLALFKRIQPQMVFHLAAQALVKKSYDDPVNTFETNLGGTVHILEAIRQTAAVQTAVMITSDKCYKNVEWEYGYRETDELGGLDPYGASKACAEMAIQAYRHSFFSASGSAEPPAVASTRAGNVIGGGDWSEKRIVPDIMRALIARKPVELRQPQATRPWQFVLEPLSGYLWLGAKMLTDHTLTCSWNFGPEPAAIVPVNTLTQKIIAAWGSGSIKALSPLSDFHEASLLSLDIAKARQKLRWRPTLTLDETIDFTVQWYKKFAEQGPEPMYECACQQISDYTRIAKKRGLVWVL
ncbi:CDP-glucose 4,6-dehydratase [candidate division CSSED10-310 bacterium]|uniref:CDP-glucose 4,6-dehydratase n=1 Tax=candidate division CSSED10-310 bacterium TaxID=2855610 RepID=A0ABV6YSF5_UNCC1